MRSLTIDLPDDTATYFDTLPFDAQKRMEQEANILVTAYINQRKADAEGLNGVDPDELRWWNGLTPQQREEERVALARGLADIDSGRTRPAEEVYARIRAKYAAHSLGTANHDAIK